MANEYRVGSLLREALGTALLGTLRAPLGFLRGIFRKDQGEQFDLRPVPFAAGSAVLGPEGEARIAEIARLSGRQTRARHRPDSGAEPRRSRARADRRSRRPLDALAELARARAAAVSERLTKGHGIEAGRVTTETWQPAEPQIEGDPGVDVQLRAN